MHVTLKEITRDNFEQVIDLELTEAQRSHLTPNVRSLVESHYHPETHYPRAIYVDDQIAGFILWSIDLPDEVIIFRFMVDAKWQKKGIGRQALQVAIDEISSHDGVDEILICYSPENSIAKRVYLSMGFVEQGMDGDDMIATLKVR